MPERPGLLRRSVAEATAAFALVFADAVAQVAAQLIGAALGAFACQFIREERL
jgi:hypothetical protein